MWRYCYHRFTEDFSNRSTLGSILIRTPSVISRLAKSEVCARRRVSKKQRDCIICCLSGDISGNKRVNQGIQVNKSHFAFNRWASRLFCLATATLYKPHCCHLEVNRMLTEHYINSTASVKYVYFYARVFINV